MKIHARDTPCMDDGCAEPVGRKGARGMCPKHYYILMRDSGPAKAPRPSAADRFLAKVDKTDTCWNWTGARKENDYGSFWYNGRIGYAHRASWEMENGAIPEGMLVDHLCFNHGCVNPSHMRLVTQKQNQENRAGQRSDNTSGYRGVSWKSNRWIAEVYHHGRSIYVGSFRDREAANEAAIAARNELFTHNNLDRLNMANPKKYTLTNQKAA